MFSFHKPRVYRSTEGCCICRAKSSSSRFTDSRKYEADSMKCFDLSTPRYGEICNACVLLVKRYKRLPVGSQRHWGHVVDARAGPGTKTLTKMKRSKEESSRGNNTIGSSPVHQNGKSVISEKFSKIFKKSKNKKLKTNLNAERENATTAHKSPSKYHTKMTLFKRPNSIDSDNEHSRDSSPVATASQNIVQFQTQTRSSTYRAKNSAKIILKQSTSKATSTRKLISKINGSKRRKKLPPQKNRPSRDSSLKFFDETEWTHRTTCCGIVYECAKLPGAIIIDMDHYKPCNDHQSSKRSAIEKVDDNRTVEKSQKTIKATLPTLVKLNLPLIVNNPTPVLKKHHLFYKRQSESFPQGDIAATTDSTTKLKTECNPKAINVLANSNSTIENKLPESIAPSKFQITNMPLQSSAKIATIVTPLDKPLSPNTNNVSGTKSSSFLHKIKSDAGKIVKHSIEKLNSAVRLKNHDLSDIKNIVKTVDKNYIISKAITTAAIAQNVPIKTGLAIPDLSPTSSSSTKFSDNSSDSGFDENVQDRKSVSPLQQENDMKLVAQPIQTLILASGVKVHGQQQNLLYAGNETAAKILQNRIQQSIAIKSNNSNTVLQHNKLLNVQPLSIDAAAALKLVQAKNSNNIVSIAPCSVGGVKVRALYNSNSGAIQHENGITTIVPASSIDAVKQTDGLMQGNTLNTVTITPTSSTNLGRQSTNTIGVNYQYNESSENITNAHVNNQNQHNLNTASLNQKIILLKTNTNTNFCHNFNNNNHKSTGDLI